LQNQKKQMSRTKTTAVAKTAKKSGVKQAKAAKRVAAVLEDENVAYDIDGYRDAPAGLRVWAGSTIEVDDLKALTKWIDWALAITASEFSK